MFGWNLAYFGGFWYILVESGIFWWILVYFVGFGYLLVESGICWWILVYFGGFWYNLAESGIFWWNLVYFGGTGYILADLGRLEKISVCSLASTSSCRLLELFWRKVTNISVLLTRRLYS